MYFSAKELVEASKRPGGVDFYSFRKLSEGPGLVYNKGSVSLSNITFASAKTELRAMRDAVLAYGQRKSNRPWYIADISAQLDPEQTWIGVEFETGFNGISNYRRAMNYIWNHLRYVAIDREGCGEYATEITFPPQNLSKYEEGKSNIHKLYSWLGRQERNGGLADMTNQTMVGTHINISTPAFRALAENTLTPSTICAIINRSLHSTTADERRQLFGRNPYGFGYLRSSGSDRWIEFKLFKSTASVAEFNGYIEVAKKIAEAMEWLARRGGNQGDGVFSNDVGRTDYDGSIGYPQGSFKQYLLGNVESPFINSVNERQAA